MVPGATTILLEEVDFDWSSIIFYHAIACASLVTLEHRGAEREMK
jgi:hypothetical protein